MLPYLYSQKNWLAAEKVGAAIFIIVPIVPDFLSTLSFINSVIFAWTYGWGIVLILIAQIQRARSAPIPQQLNLSVSEA